MDRIGEYDIRPFSQNRRNITLIVKEGARKHNVHALLEIDVTKARYLIKEYKKKKNGTISFTGWVIKCVAQAISSHRELNAYRHGKRHVFTFEDVDVPIPVERKVAGETRPMAYIIRQANKKNVVDITQEIRKVQKEGVSKTTQLLGGHLTRLERFALHSPMFIKKMVLFIARRSALLKKKHMGTVGVSSIGMFGKFPGWAIPLGIPATLIVVGGLNQKPGVVNGKIEIREYLNLTITVDHDLVDGGPLARFVSLLTELMENGFGLTNIYPSI
jgi:pyruvate/2-oxoglutarate dehydrogenase complex dihydrolipoamide acyltransferase (E2) component